MPVSAECKVPDGGCVLWEGHGTRSVTRGHVDPAHSPTTAATHGGGADSAGRQPGGGESGEEASVAPHGRTSWGAGHAQLAALAREGGGAWGVAFPLWVSGGTVDVGE